MSETSNTPAASGGAAGAPAKPSPELQALMDQNAILAQQVTAVQNQAKLISTALPSDVKPLDGVTKTEGDHPVESQFLAYRAVQAIAQKIADDPSMPVANHTVVIYCESELNSLLSYQSFRQQLELLQTQMTQERDRAQTQLKTAQETIDDTARAFRDALPIVAPLLATSAVKSAVDLLSLFRTDVDIRSKDIPIADQALIAPLAAALAAKRVKVFHPSVLPPKFLDPASDLLKALEDLAGLRNDLQDKIDDAAAKQALLKRQSDTLAQEIAVASGLKKTAADLAVEASTDKQAALKKEQAENAVVLQDMETFTGIQSKDADDRKVAKDSMAEKLDGLVTRLNAVNASYATLQAALVKGDDTSPLVKLIRAEKLKAAMGTGGFTLQIKMAASGGGVQVKRNLLYSKVSYSGGAIATWMLFNPDGSVKGGGIARDYTGLIEVGSRPENEKDLAEFNRA